MSASNRRVWTWDRDEEPGENAMRFRLTYVGELKSGQKEVDSRLEHKHDIRRQFHPQIKELWAIHPGLIELAKTVNQKTGRLIINEWADGHLRAYNHRFLPLGQKAMNLMCKIEILLLRRPESGGGIYTKGDLDNRTKSLLDALQIPKNGAGLPPGGPSTEEQPYICALFDDDNMISHLSVETDYLLGEIPKTDMAGNSLSRTELDVRATLSVTLEPYAQSNVTVFNNISFSGANETGFSWVS